MNIALWAGVAVAGLVELVCWFYWVVQIFKRESVMRGLLGLLCGVYAFHYGWRNASGYDLRRAERDQPPFFKRMMLVWTLCLLVTVVVPRVLGA